MIEVEKNSKVYYDYFRDLQKGNKSKVIYSTAINTLTCASIKHLSPGNWLNNEVINLFMEYLSCREEQSNIKRDDGQIVKIFRTHFLTKLSSSSYSGTERTYSYKNVRRLFAKGNKMATRKVKNIFEYDKIICPYHLDAGHWGCACIHVHEKTIQMYDSLMYSNDFHLRCLMQYLCDEYVSDKNQFMDLSDWKMIRCQGTSPQQENGTFESNKKYNFFCIFILIADIFLFSRL